MKIACLSGKGGAGKTLVAVNLAVAGCDTYLDCDVEEPNGRIFLKPEQVESRRVTTTLPEFDPEKCTGCKKCVAFCRFHALTYVKEKPTVFPQVCHSCGGCSLVCPEGAVTEAPKAVGTVETGCRDRLQVVTGILDPAEASGVPVIRQVLESARGLTVIDCPPGSACSVMECAAQAEVCLLVAEPTAFGLHDLEMVHQLCKLLGKPCAVVINKQEAPYGPLEEFCRREALPVLARIPYDPELGRLVAQGKIPAQAHGTYEALFRQLLDRLGGGL